MALVLADRVRETTTTTGTGTISLGGPVSGFQGFSTAIGNANTTYYTIADAATGAWEVGLGTYTSSGSTLARTTILSSSNAGAAVNFAAGTKDVFVTQPAERALYLNGAGTGVDAGAAAFTSNGVPYANSTSTLTTGSALTFDGTTLTSGSSGTATKLVLQGGNQTSMSIKSSTGTSGFLLGRGFASDDANTFFIFDLATSQNRFYIDATPRIFQYATEFGWSNAANSAEYARLTNSGLEIKQSQLIGYSSYAGIGTNGLAVAGNVGVGTASPNAKLTVGDPTGAAIAIPTTANFYGTNSIASSIGTVGLFSTETAGADVGPVLTFGGKTGNTFSPYPFGFIQGAKESATAGNYAGYLRFLTVPADGGSPILGMHLSSVGNLGIGTATPASRLVVQQANNTGDGIRLFASGSDSQLITRYLAASDVWQVTASYASSGAYKPIAWFTSDLERARISSDGTFRVKGAGTAGTTDAFQVAGTAPASAVSITSGGVLQLGSGITFPATQSESANANTLDDYEEGIWVPNQGSGLTVVGAFSSVGRYTKIGNVVTVWGQVTGATSIAVSAIGFICTNLPFALQTDIGAQGAATGFWTSMNSVVHISIGDTTSVYAAQAISGSATIAFTITYRF